MSFAQTSGSSSGGGLVTSVSDNFDVTSGELELAATIAVEELDSVLLTDCTANAPTLDAHVATKEYVDDEIAGVSGGGGGDRPLVISNTTTSTAIANTTTVSGFDQEGTIPADTLRVGDVIEVYHVIGYGADTAATIFPRGWVNATEYIMTGFTALLTATNRVSLKSQWVVKAIGAGGVLELVDAKLNHASVAHGAAAPYSIPTNAAIDFTPAWGWSAAAVNNSAAAVATIIVINGVPA
jgi:hypothetical protein